MFPSLFGGVRMLDFYVVQEYKNCMQPLRAPSEKPSNHADIWVSPLFAKAHTSKSSYVPPQQHREMACFSLIFIDNRDKIIKIYDKTHQTLIIFKGGGAHPDSICL